MLSRITFNPKAAQDLVLRVNTYNHWTTWATQICASIPNE